MVIVLLEVDFGVMFFDCLVYKVGFIEVGVVML